MTISIGGYSFQGPYSSTGSLKNQSGVYVILTPTSNDQYKVLDAGESSAVRERVETHERASCWKRNANSGGIKFAVYYTPGQSADSRRKIERAVRDQYAPPCGKV